jgi:hypothetical protein
MRPKIYRAAIEMSFIIFLFYANLLMGEFERSNGTHKSVTAALWDIFTVRNFIIAAVSSLVGYVTFEFLRRKS